MQVWAIAAIFLILLCSCAAKERASTAQRAQGELVGLKKAEILACAGAPARAATADDVEVLTYVGGGDSRGVATGVGGPGVGTAVLTTHRRYCEATFVLRNGVVEKINYSGRTGGLATKGEQCAFVVQNCVR